MKHLDENTIELYVLGGKNTKDKKFIEKHLRRCAGCRELEELIRSLYTSVEEELKNPAAGSPTPGQTLARIEREIDLWNSYQPPAVRPSNTAVTWWQRTLNTIRHRPVASIIGSLGFIGAITLVIMYSATNLFKDRNPSYVHYNLGAGMVEVYNKENAKLWEMPSDALSGAKEGDDVRNMNSTIVADLNGNGQNLVISTVQMANDLHGNSLRIIDGNMKVLGKVEYGARHVQFREKQYEAQFNPFQPIVAKTGKDWSILTISNNGRSPCVVTRYDPSGKVLGEYWHFGNLRAGYTVDLNNDDKDELILIGTNDVGPADADNFPMIAILDPSKITGESEATSTKGFGFSPSQAELSYIRLNLDQICHDFQSFPIIDKLLSTSENVLRFTTNAYAPGRGVTFPGFEFVFDKHLNSVEVKNDDQTVREIDRLRAQGKTSITLNTAYLDRIKHAIRYWDGEKWTKDVKKIEAGLDTK